MVHHGSLDCPFPHRAPCGNVSLRVQLCVAPLVEAVVAIALAVIVVIGVWQWWSIDDTRMIEKFRES